MRGRSAAIQFQPFNRKPATFMTGFIGTDAEAAVRRRLAERINCPAGVDFLSLQTERAGNSVGAHILHYRVVIRCLEVARS